MDWEKKTEFVRLLNSGKNKEATAYFLKHENWSNWDDVQALSMYANGIDLTKPEDCRGFEDKLKELQVVHKERYGKLDFRASLRLAMLQEAWKEKEYTK